MTDLIQSFCIMGSSEKFCLKWNDFQENISNKSFSNLRKEAGLFDVTLVSSDQQQVSAHRLVLSACSDFFKTIFHSNTHSHPLLYLDGVDNREINLMLDYIYQGEVQIYQENLERFLVIANKFQLDGLLATQENENSEPNFEDTVQQVKEVDNIEDPVAEASNIRVKERDLKVISQTFEASNYEVEEKFHELKHTYTYHNKIT